MASPHVFSGSIPETYQRYLVPLIFQPYAQDMARRVAESAPQEVLEIAAGTGVVTRAMAGALPPGTPITATDINPGMLEQAIATQPSDRPVAWRQADALDLPFTDHSVDAVVCQFGVMFFPDRVQGYREARRVLRPNGRFFFSAWDRIAENEFPHIVEEALAALFPENATRFMSRAPHSYHDQRLIRDDVEAAGFSDLAIEPVNLISHAASARDVAVTFCEGTPLRNEIEACAPDRLEEAVAVCEEALKRRFGTGPVEGRIRALVMTAKP